MKPVSMGEAFLGKKDKKPQKNNTMFYPKELDLRETQPDLSYVVLASQVPLPGLVHCLSTRSIRPKVKGRVEKFALEISGNFSGAWD